MPPDNPNPNPTAVCDVCVLLLSQQATSDMQLTLGHCCLAVGILYALQCFPHIQAIAQHLSFARPNATVNKSTRQPHAFHGSQWHARRLKSCVFLLMSCMRLSEDVYFKEKE